MLWCVGRVAVWVMDRKKCSSLVRKRPSSPGAGSETSPEPPKDNVSRSPQSGQRVQTRPTSRGTQRCHAPVCCYSSVLCRSLGVPLVKVKLLVLRRVVLLLLVVACWRVVVNTVSHSRLSLGAKMCNGPGPALDAHGRAEQDAEAVSGPCPALVGGCRHGPSQ